MSSIPIEQHIAAIAASHPIISFVETEEQLVGLGRANLQWLLEREQRDMAHLQKAPHKTSELNSRWDRCHFLKAMARAASEAPAFPRFRNANWIAQEKEVCVRLRHEDGTSEWLPGRIALVWEQRDLKRPQAVLFYRRSDDGDREAEALRETWGMGFTELMCGAGAWYGYHSGNLLLEWELEYLRTHLAYAERFAGTCSVVGSAVHKKYLTDLGFAAELSLSASVAT